VEPGGGQLLRHRALPLRTLLRGMLSDADLHGHEDLPGNRL